ncbi:MAG: 2Fe-2S iron-sulfur cluster binding domain-containing protein [Acidobacteria bacterium]|nr:2Fe-2S iron-sulfur cluster binding domain-containing protein [Acidobacteriota bacterium]
MNAALGDILEKYDRLIPITILGVTYDVPENNTFLRLLQYLGFNIVYGRFCWNGDCRNCAFRYRSPDGHDRTALGCQTIVRPGTAVLKLPPGTAPGEPPPADPHQSPGTLTPGPAT